jgi:hypothetical protein
VVRSCEHSNKTFDSIKGLEFVNQQSDYELVRKDSASWN